MQMKEPLTLTLPPSDGEREPRRASIGEYLRSRRQFSLSPSNGETVGVRGILILNPSGFSLQPVHFGCGMRS